MPKTKKQLGFETLVFLDTLLHDSDTYDPAQQIYHFPTKPFSTMTLSIQSNSYSSLRIGCSHYTNRLLSLQAS